MPTYECDAIPLFTDLKRKMTIAQILQQLWWMATLTASVPITEMDSTEIGIKKALKELHSIELDITTKKSVVPKEPKIATMQSLTKKVRNSKIGKAIKELDSIELDIATKKYVAPKESISEMDKAIGELDSNIATNSRSIAPEESISEVDQFIEELNSKIPNKQWVPKKNFDSFDQVIPLLGGSPSPSAKKSGYRSFFPDDGTTLDYEPPKSFDARAHWPECESIRTIWDQGGCGSCWAIAAASAISDRICIHTGEQVMVSAEQLFCATERGCVVGTQMEAWDYWLNHGLVSGGGYGRTDTCMPYSLPKCNHGKGIDSYEKCQIEPTPRCKY